MRYAAGHKAETRRKVLGEAAKTVRAEGIHKVAVAPVMAGAGLTHGGFYAHFRSREDLLGETVEHMFGEGAERLALSLRGRSPTDGLANYIDFYLSAEHRDARTGGCPIPVLATDAPRLSAALRGRITAGSRDLENRVATVLTLIGRNDAEADAQSMFAEMVGALLLARAEPDRARSDQLLANVRASLKHRLGLI